MTSCYTILKPGFTKISNSGKCPNYMSGFSRACKHNLCCDESICKMHVHVNKRKSEIYQNENGGIMVGFYFLQHRFLFFYKAQIIHATVPYIPGEK